MGQTFTFPNSRFLRSTVALAFLLAPWLITAQPMQAFITATPIDCNTGYGYATVTVTGTATPPFTYLWSNGLTTQNVVIAPGTYTVTVTDFTGQTATATTTLVQPPQLTVAVVIENQICGISPDGSATALPTGGTPPLSYLWNTGATTSQITGLTAGIYTVTVSDAAGCTAVASGEVEFWDEGLWTMITNTDITCFGAANGMLEAGAMSGTPPYTYLWNTGATTKKINNLTPGTYTVTITDANGCSAQIEGSVTQPSQLLLTISGSSYNGCDTTTCVTVSLSGGTPDYSILWNTGDTTNSVCNLPPGSYSVTVTDANDCTATGSIALSPNPFVLQVVATPNSCAGCNGGGSATAVVSNGTGSYTYQWSSGGSTGPIGINLNVGINTVTVTDTNTGCSATATVTIVACPPLDVQIAITAEATCTTGGSASAAVAGGTPPYTITWSNGQTGPNATNLPAGTNTVTVTDATGCIAVTNFVMPQTGGLTIDVTVTAQAGCLTGGSATATVSGGIPPYTITWSNGQTGPNATNLPAGTNTVTATDAGTCSSVATFTVTQAPNPTVSVSVTAQATCLTGGSATATGSGGTPPYSYTWSNGQTGPNATNLPVGTNTVTVTDAAGCTGTASFSVTHTPLPSATATVLSHAQCANNGFGSASATGIGGTAPYTYLWDNGETTSTAVSLTAGNHCVTVTDAAGCTAVACVTILPANPPQPSITVITQATCNTGATISVSVTGGTPPYTYHWSNGANTGTITNVPPGVYTVTVTDAANCTGTASITVQPPAHPTVVITASANATCYENGSASAAASGGIPPYSYVWSNGETGPTAINLPAGTYTVTVTDAGGCTGTATVTIGFVSNGIKIGDFVWYDNDQDGYQDIQENTGVGNVSVMLIAPGPDNQFGTSDDVTVDNTTTDNNGMYMFNCVGPGTYILMFSGIPAGYQWTGKDQANNCYDSDVNSNGKTDPFTITAGQGNNFCFDAGIHTICYNLTYPGEVCCSQTICEGETPNLLYESVAPSGGSGSIEYLWMVLAQVGQAPPIWQGISGATSSSYQPGPLYQTTYFRRCVRRDGCEHFLESNVVTITVLPAGSPGCAPMFNKFDVHSLSNYAVEVDWETPAEPVPYMYTVEHSMDKQNWAPVATEMGRHNTTAVNAYAVVHQTPLAGLNYYRIKRSSLDGTIAYSDERTIDLDLPIESTVGIYPNPVTNTLYIKNMAVYDADVQIDMISTQGEVIHQLSIPQGTLQQIELPVNTLPAGLYFLRVRFGSGEVRTIKITKF